MAFLPTPSGRFVYTRWFTVDQSCYRLVCAQWLAIECLTVLDLWVAAGSSALEFLRVKEDFPGFGFSVDILEAALSVVACFVLVANLP